jgi:hypothetical protein
LTLIALVGLSPLPLAAQRIEVAALSGRYQPTPRYWFGDRFDCDCDPADPLGSFYLLRLARNGSGIVGGRIGFFFGPRLGAELTVYRALSVNDLVFDRPGGSATATRERVTTIFVALQPQWRLPANGFIEFTVAAGPVTKFVSVVSPDEFTAATQAGARVGVGASAAVRARLAGPVTLELRGSDQLFFGRGGPSYIGGNDLFWSAGLAYAIRQ